MDAQILLNMLVRCLGSIFLSIDSTSIFSVVSAALFIVGLWGILQKAGIKSWWALIPCARYARLGEAAGRDVEGRVVAMTDGLMIISRLVIQFIDMILVVRTPENKEALSRFSDFLVIFNVVIVIIQLIYLIRVYLGLIEVYNRKKRWIILWVLIEGVTACLWGWQKKFAPQWTAREMKIDASSFFSNSKATVLAQGLTVNLEERTATELFKKKYLLRDIHMTIQPGRMVLLLGGSGAGKTTFLNAVNGLREGQGGSGAERAEHVQKLQGNAV